MEVLKRSAGILLVLLLPACAVGPDYRKPDVPVPAQWQAPLPHGGQTAALTNWWAQFDDPLLAELIAQAEKDSPTLAQAVARIAESRATVAMRQTPLTSLRGKDANASQSIALGRYTSCS